MTSAEILVVDDEPDIRTVLTLTLRRAGYRVVTAVDGADALEKLATLVPDLVMLDVMMPRMDGLETLRKIRDDRRLARLPVILLTAKAQIADRVAGLERGADDYVAKPFAPAEMLARVQSLLRRTEEARRTSPLLRLLGSWSSAEGLAQFERDLEAAREIQERLRPEIPPTLGGLELGGVLHPSSVVGGDFLDLFSTARGIGVAVGDVSGKGISAALVMVMVRTLLREIASGLAGPTEILPRLNASLCRDMPPSMFVTMALAVIDPERPGHVAVGTGGHPDPVLLGPDGALSTVTIRGALLGAFSDAAFDAVELDLAPGQALVLYTDGVVEDRGEEGAGRGTLDEVLRAAAGGGASEIAERVARAALERAGDRLRDDVTVFVLKR